MLLKFDLNIFEFDLTFNYLTLNTEALRALPDLAYVSHM